MHVIFVLLTVEMGKKRIYLFFLMSFEFILSSPGRTDPFLPSFPHKLWVWVLAHPAVVSSELPPVSSRPS